MRPEIEACRGSHQRLLATAEHLTDASVREPSLLPQWTRALVLTHLARNADSFSFLLEGARIGEVRRQYPSLDARSSDIAAGAGRSADELRDDLRRACTALERAWDELSDDQWDNEVTVASGTRVAGDLAFGRLREVEVHHVDLGAGYTAADWPTDYVEGELARLVENLPERTDRRDLLAWMLNR